MEKTDLNMLIPECADITRQKGFDVSQNMTQLLLIASEVAEALAHVTDSHNERIDAFAGRLEVLFAELAHYRKDAQDFTDESTAPHTGKNALEIGYSINENEELRAFVEELADVAIRLFSYVGGNGLGVVFIDVLMDKIEKNRQREELHGKKF